MMATGHTVAVIDNLSTGRVEYYSDVDFYKCEVRDSDMVEYFFDQFRPEAVIHHAAQIDVRISIEPQ
jgi:UDP-glucose 4-epimerase